MLVIQCRCWLCIHICKEANKASAWPTIALCCAKPFFLLIYLICDFEMSDYFLHITGEKIEISVS